MIFKMYYLVVYTEHQGGGGWAYSMHELFVLGFIFPSYYTGIGGSGGHPRLWYW